MTAVTDNFDDWENGDLPPAWTTGHGDLAAKLPPSISLDGIPMDFAWLPAGIAQAGDIVKVETQAGKWHATVTRDGQVVWTGEVTVDTAIPAPPST